MKVLATTMARVWFLCSCLFAALVPTYQYSHESALSTEERYLYAQLREIFFQQQTLPNYIWYLPINITADFIAANYCSVDCPCCECPCEPAFRPIARDSYTSTGTVFMTVTWSVPTDVDAVHFIEVLAYVVIPWCTHGLSAVVATESHIIHLSENSDIFGYRMPNYDVLHEPIKLSVKTLDCQPFICQLNRAAGKLLSWIKVYAEAGGKPQSWDPKQQAKVQQNPGSECFGGCQLSFFDWKSTMKYLYVYGFVGYLLLTLLFFVLIPKLFWEYHDKLICKNSSPAFKSVYWGTAVVSLFLVIILMLGKIYFLSFGQIFVYSYVAYDIVYSESAILPQMANIVVEILIPVVFLVISIIASKTSKAVPMLAAKFTTYVFFCCPCCSSQCKLRGVQIFTLWTFMTVIHYHITEAVAVAFTLFISVPLALSCVLIYVSGVFFAIMLVSIILFSCRSTGRPQSTSAIYLGVVNVGAILLGVLSLIFVFVAFIPMYSILSNTDEKGSGIDSLKLSLLPSLALSAAGWLIRKKLLKANSHADPLDHLTDYGATGHSLSDGGRDEQGPEERQHLV